MLLPVSRQTWLVRWACPARFPRSSGTFLSDGEMDSALQPGPQRMTILCKQGEFRTAMSKSAITHLSTAGECGYSVTAPRNGQG